MKSKKSPSIFIVEDDPFYQEIIKHELNSHNYYQLEIYSDGESCLENMHKAPNVVLLDYNLGDNLNGLQVLRKIKKLYPEIEVIMLSAQESIEVATNSIQHGAFDYVSKTDFAMKRINLLVDRIWNWNKMVHINKRNKKYQTAATIGLGMFCVLVFVLSIYYPEYFD